MNRFTGKDRIAAAFAREHADRVPTTLMLSPYYGASLVGATHEEIDTNAEKDALSIIRLYQEFHPDSLIVGGAGAPVADAKSAKHVLEDKSLLATLKPPDPTKKGKRIAFYLEVCERVISAVPDATIAGMVRGPWTNSTVMRGDQALIFDTMDDPEFVHELMRYSTVLTKRAGSEIVGTGVTQLLMGEPASSCSLVSPDIYREFIKPYHREIMDFFRKKNVEIIMHVCGFIDPIMEELVDAGIGGISLDSASSLKRMVEVSHGRVVVVGNVATSLFLEGTRDQMQAAVKECIDTAGRGSAYILCSGCEVPLNAPMENVRYFMEAAGKFGRYDSK